jgi:hypothetical protein
MNTSRIRNSVSSECVFPPVTTRDPGDTRTFYYDEPICYKKSILNSTPISYKEAKYIKPGRTYRNSKIYGHDISVNGLYLVDVDYRKIGKFQIKENVMKNIIETKTGKSLPPHMYRGYGGKTRKIKKSRKNSKSRKYGRK